MRILNPLCVLCVLGGYLIGSPGGTAFAQQPSALQRSLQIRQAQMPSDGEVHVLPVQGNVYMLVGAGGNIAVQIGEEGVLVVDTGLAAMSDKVLAAIKKLSPKTIRYILNTHLHPDHTGGNEVIGKAGSTTAGAPTTVMAHENTLSRMSAPLGKPGAAAPGLWPSDTFFPEEKDFFNDEAGCLSRRGGASMATCHRLPALDVGGRRYFDHELSCHRHAERRSVRHHRRPEPLPTSRCRGTSRCGPAVPGSWHLCDESGAWLLGYGRIIKERIEDMVKRGMTLIR